MRSTERRYKARIIHVYGADGPMDQVFYDAEAIDTPDVAKMIHVAPFRREFFTDGVEVPDIKTAKVGDDCDIAVCQGEVRLTNVPEQYIVGPCDQT